MQTNMMQHFIMPDSINNWQRYLGRVLPKYSSSLVHSIQVFHVRIKPNTASKEISSISKDFFFILY